MLEGIYEELGMNNTYNVWYETLNRKIKRRKSFANLEGLTKWLKINKNKINVTGGSGEVFNILDDLKGNKNVSSESDLIWKFGKAKAQ